MTSPSSSQQTPLFLEQSYSAPVESDVLKATISTEQHYCSTIKKNGYTVIKTVQDTLQGELIKAAKISNKSKYVAIKKVNKILHHKKITKNADGSCTITHSSILKEALIFNVITHLNVPIIDYICKFIDFFEDNENYYLVTEWIPGDMNLTKFIKIAHQYIKSGQLSIKDWTVIAKYIHWQLVVCIHWMHLNMNCCHLDLVTDNILLTNCNFIQNVDGSISIDLNIGIKICDFGVAEIFLSCTNFKCDKFEITNDYQFKCPQAYNEQVYNGKLSDVWSLGLILYKMCIGYDPYQYAEPDLDPSYHSIKNNRISAYIKQNNLNCFFNSKIISLLSGMLSYREKNRFSTKDILQHNWYKSYFNRFNPQFKFLRIAPQYNPQVLNLKSFPYYSIKY